MDDIFLNVSEMFYSIQGESSYSGLPFTFIRLSGCNLRCSFCDTTYAYEKGDKLSIEEIIAKVKSFPTDYVEVTGGEPLMQENSLLLIDALLEEGYKVLLETNGSMDLSKVHRNVIKIVDIKCPGSNEEGSFDLNNLSLLKSDDEVKFVISSKDDYYFAKKMIRDHALNDKCGIIMSVANGTLPLKTLSKWILSDGIIVRVQMQLHKHIFDGERGR